MVRCEPLAAEPCEQVEGESGVVQGVGDRQERGQQARVADPDQVDEPPGICSGLLEIRSGVEPALELDDRAGQVGLRSGDEVPQLWAITANRVFAIPLDEKDRRARKGRALKLANASDTADSSYVPGGQALAVGDLTGDGLLDLVIAAIGGAADLDATQRFQMRRLELRVEEREAAFAERVAMLAQIGKKNILDHYLVLFYGRP